MKLGNPYCNVSSHRCHLIIIHMQNLSILNPLSLPPIMQQFDTIKEILWKTNEIQAETVPSGT